jgi:hypothetical protein
MNVIEHVMRILKGRSDVLRESDELFQRNIIIRKTIYQRKENDIHGRIHRCTWGRRSISFAIYKRNNQDTGNIAKKKKQVDDVSDGPFSPVL